MHPTARSSTSCASSKPASAAFHGRQRYNNLIVTRRPSSARIQVAAHEEGGLGRRVNYYVGIDCVIGCTEPVGCRWQRHRHLQGKVARQPQTAGELRMNCERLHCFADIQAVEALLSELAERSDGALVTRLPRQPGSRENRWMHLLSGAPVVQSSSAAGLAAESPSLGISELAAVKANVARLEAEVHELKDLLAKVCAQLGIKH
jgi:hypothetical protein